MLSIRVTQINMKHTLYKPNSKNTGSAFSFDSVKDKEGRNVLFVSMIQQHSWDDKRKNGSFKENAKNQDKSATIKLSFVEAGEFISSFRSRKPFVAFHRNKEETTIIKLTPWDKKRKIVGQEGDEWHETPAWGLSVIRNSAQTFKLPIEAGESVVIEELLKSYIRKCLEANTNEYNKNSPQKEYKSPQKEYKKPEQENKSKDSFSDDVPF
jgi:hypothetical protein